MHLSELHLRSKGKAPKTWLDTYNLKVEAIERKEDKFAEQENSIREKARERAVRGPRQAGGRGTRAPAGRGGPGAHRPPPGRATLAELACPVARRATILF